MTKYCGSQFLIQIEDPGTPGTFLTIASLRSTGMSINNEQVDVTDKGSMPWRELAECGVRTMSLTGAGVFTDDETHDLMMQNSVTDGETIKLMKLVSGRGDFFTGLFQIATMDRSGEFNGAEEYSMSFESAAVVTYQAAP